MGRTRGRRVVPVVDREYAWKEGPDFLRRWRIGGQCKEMGGIVENEHDFHRVRFRDALAGHPTSWVPLVFSLS